MAVPLLIVLVSAFLVFVVSFFFTEHASTGSSMGCALFGLVMLVLLVAGLPMRSLPVLVASLCVAGFALCFVVFTLANAVSVRRKSF